MSNELAKECRAFVETIMDWRGSKLEKAQFEIDWCVKMEQKYPELRYGFRRQRHEAIQRYDEASKTEPPTTKTKTL